MSTPARDLLGRLDAAGVTLALDGTGNLRLKAAAPPPADLLAEARRLKPELLALLSAEAANGNAAGPLLPLPEIAGLVEAIAGAAPLAAPDVLREAACRMRRAGHCRHEIAATLLPGLPPATLGMAALLALEDGLADAVGCLP
jgi:hypothetical protein